MSDPVVSRNDWSARAPKRPFTKLRTGALGVAGIVLHHGGVKDSEPGPGTVKAFERYHMGTNGWNAIAYNWLVDAAGVIYEGRGAGVVSGATFGWNSRTESICYTGWGSGDVPQVALAAIKRTVSEIESRYTRDLWVKPHRAFASTTCPGTTLTQWLQAGMVLDSDDEPEDAPAMVQAKLDAIGRRVARRPLATKRRAKGRLRSKGKAVRLVQRRLAKLGYEPGFADGIYGRLTAKAVRRYQRAKGLKADGVVGKKTWASMFDNRLRP